MSGDDRPERSSAATRLRVTPSGDDRPERSSAATRLRVTPSGSRLRVELDGPSPGARPMPPELADPLEQLRRRLELAPDGLVRVVPQTNCRPCARARALLSALGLPPDAPAETRGTCVRIELELACDADGPALDLTLDFQRKRHLLLSSRFLSLERVAPELGRVEGLRELAALNERYQLRRLRARGETMAIALLAPERVVTGDARSTNPVDERVAAYVTARLQRSAGRRLRDVELQTRALLELTRPYSHIASTLARVVVARRAVELDLEHLEQLGGEELRRCAELLGSLGTLDDIWTRARRCQSVQTFDPEGPALLVLLGAATLLLEDRRARGQLPPARWAEVLPYRLAITRVEFLDAATRFDAAIGPPPHRPPPPEEQVTLWAAIYDDGSAVAPKRALVEYLRDRDPARAEALERAVQQRLPWVQARARPEHDAPPRPPLRERARQWFARRRDPAPTDAPPPPPLRDSDWLGPLMADEGARASPHFPDLRRFSPNLGPHTPPDYPAALANCWMLAGLRSLRLRAPICERRLQVFLRSPYLRRVTRIDVGDAKLSPEAIAALVEAESLASVTALLLDGDTDELISRPCVDIAHLERLLRVPAIARLRHLSLAKNDLPVEAAELLIACPYLEGLERLSVLSQNFTHTRQGGPTARERTIARLVRRFGERLELHRDPFVQQRARDHE